jgi:hypothetical protein
LTACCPNRGEINDSQREAWCRVIEAFDEQTQQRTQLALFPAERELPEYARHRGQARQSILLKNPPFILREPPFDRAQDGQDERRSVEIREDFPFMLSLSKHS